MKIEILNGIEELNAAIKKSRVYKKLNYYESKINSDKKVLCLVNNKNLMVSKYNDYIKYNDNNSETALKLMNNISKAKEDLYKNKYVKKYLYYYKKYKAIIDEINKILFKDFQVNLCTKNNPLE